MIAFFERIPLDGTSEFTLFSVSHIVALCSMLALIWFSYQYLPKLKGHKAERFVRYGIILYLISSSFYKQWFYVVSDVPWYVHLPEATCGLAIITAILALLTKNRTMFILTFFWGWGAFTALFAPNILEGPTRYYFYQFQLRHALIVISALYMIRVFEFKVYKQDFMMYLGVTLSLAIAGMIFSMIINDPSNLNMYYMLQPAVNNPFLDAIYAYSYPLYVVFWIGVASLLGYVYGLPFYEKSPKKQISNASSYQ